MLDSAMLYHTMVYCSLIEQWHGSMKYVSLHGRTNWYHLGDGLALYCTVLLWPHMLPWSMKTRVSGAEMHAGVTILYCTVLCCRNVFAWWTQTSLMDFLVLPQNQAEIQSLARSGGIYYLKLNCFYNFENFHSVSKFHCKANHKKYTIISSC